MKNAVLTFGLFTVLAFAANFASTENHIKADNKILASVEFDITTATTPNEIGGQQVPKDRLPF